jgi:hypothetical protein
VRQRPVRSGAFLDEARRLASRLSRCILLTQAGLTAIGRFFGVWETTKSPIAKEVLDRIAEVYVVKDKARDSTAARRVLHLAGATVVTPSGKLDLAKAFSAIRSHGAGRHGGCWNRHRAEFTVGMVVIVDARNRLQDRGRPMVYPGRFPSGIMPQTTRFLVHALLFPSG